MSKLTTAERNALPSSDFADPTHRKFPMEDDNHRKAAEMLAHTPTQKAQVKRKLNKVHAGIKKGFTP